jgi:hypothetical protein
MTAIIPTINGLLTLAESGFNIIGYLPKQKFPKFHVWAVTWRNHCGKGQLITGLALAAIGYFAHLAFPALAVECYLSIPLQMVCLGLLYANHGLYNILRSYIERPNIPGLTLVYDFYGKKVLPALNPSWDFQSQIFVKIKEILDRLIFATIFPPELAFIV